MSFNIGSAVAQGLVKGTGDALMDHAQQMQREKEEQQKWDTIMNNFKKQSVYSANVDRIKKQNVTADQWKAEASKPVAQIIDEQAREASKYVGEKQRPQFIRDYKKRQSGVTTKAQALANGGYVLPDYSEFANDPDLADAIPKAYLPGGHDDIDSSMDELYSYKDMGEGGAIAAQQAATRTGKAAVSRQKYLRSLQTTRGSLGGLAEKHNMELSDGAIEYITGVTNGAAYQYASDGTMYNTAQQAAEQGLHDGTLKIVTDPDTGHNSLMTTEAARGLSQVSAQPTTPEATDVPEAPKTAQEKAYQKKQDAAVMKERKADFKSLAKTTSGKIAMYKDMKDLYAAAQALPQDVQEDLFGSVNPLDVLDASSETARNIMAKLGNKSAQAAKNFASKLSAITSNIKHDKYGSAQSLGELANWAKEFADPSVFNNYETMTNQINEHLLTAQNAIEADVNPYGDDVKAAYYRSQGIDFGTHQGSQGTPETPPATAPKTQEQLQDFKAKAADFPYAKPEGVQDDQWNQVVAAGRAKGWDDKKVYELAKQMFPEAQFGTTQGNLSDPTGEPQETKQQPKPKSIDILSNIKDESARQSAIDAYNRGEIDDSQLEDFVQWVNRKASVHPQQQ